MKLKYTGKVEDGKLTIINRKGLIKDLASYYEGKKVTIIIEKYRKNRSNEQNSYYWGVVVEAVKIGLNDVGYKMNSEATHELIKYKFLQKELINEDTGEILQTIGSTTELSTSEFMDLLAQIQQWAAEYLNVIIPDPNQQSEIQFN